jgi:hypothetical protein
MLKKLVTLILIFLLLPAPLFAPDIYPGTGNPGTGGGGSTTATNFTSTVKSPNVHGAGLYLHVQATDQRIVPDPNDDTKASKAFGEVARYFTNHLPNTDVNSGITGVYVLPTWSQAYGSQQYAVKQSGSAKPSSRVEITPIWMNGSAVAPDIPNTLGKAAITAASTVTKSNPNPSLPANYWQTAISNYSKTTAQDIVARLFAGASSSVGLGSASDVNRITEAIDNYLGLSTTSINKVITDNENWQKAGYFYNYCGFLATVIATLPTAERDNLAKQLDTMYQEWLSGRGYSPLLVTGEIVFPTAFLPIENKIENYRHWWTPKQALWAITNKKPSDTVMTIIPGKSAIESHMMGQTAQINNGGQSMYGVPSPTGYKQYTWNGGSYAQPALVIKSLADSVITDYSLGSVKAIEGIGVWGLRRESLLQVPHTLDAGLTPEGTIGITAVKDLTKGVGGYQDVATVTLSLDLGSTSSMTAADNVITQSGPGLANTLEWMAQRRKEGASFPNPYVMLYLKQAEAHPALSGSSVNTLITKTDGYDGDGASMRLNYKNESVSAVGVEAEVGASFTWLFPELTTLDVGANGTLMNPGISGMVITTEDNGTKVEFTDQ